MAKLSKTVLLCLLGAALALCAAVGLICLQPNAVTARAAESDHTDHDGWTAITAATKSLSNGNYVLESDITLSNTLQVSVSATVTLCLNGHKLTGNGSGSVIKNYGNLTICDCQSGNEENKHYYTVDSNGQYNFVTDETTTDNYIVGGVITGGNTTSSGGGIYMSGNGKIFTLQGGTIAGNYAVSNGGGVFIEAGNFIMEGGTVIGNHAQGSESDSVYVRYANASFTMTDGFLGGGVSYYQGKIKIEGGSFDEAAMNSLQGDDNVVVAADLEFIQQEDGSYSLMTVHRHGEETFTEFGSSVLDGDVLPAGHYYLSADLLKNRAIIINSDVSFCLNGHMLYGEGIVQIFNIQNGGSLTICDCQSENEEAKHYYTVEENGLYVFTEEETENYIVGGVITKANGAVTVNQGGSFTLQGGTIAGCEVTSAANSTVRASQATLNIEGGAIVGNTAPSASSNGGGVYANNCTFTMSGGRIAENYAGQRGGGIYVSGGTFTMTGGQIEANTAEQGGGVYLYDGTMNIEGTPVIQDNIAGGIDSDTDGRIGITVTGTLSAGARIGLGEYEGVEIVVSGYSEYNTADPVEYFFSNIIGNSVILQSDGSIILAQTYTIKYYNGSSLLGSQLAFYEKDSLTTFEDLGGAVAEGNKFYGWTAAPGSLVAIYTDGQELAVPLAEAGGAISLYAVIAEEGSGAQEQIDSILADLKAAVDTVNGALQGETTAEDLAEALGDLIDAYRAADKALQDKIGELEGLETEDKTSVVAAINSLKGALEQADVALQGAVDAINSEIEQAIEAVLGADYDAESSTLADAMAELLDLIGSAQSAIDALGDTCATDSELATAVETLSGTISTAKGELEGKIGEINTTLEEAVAALEALKDEDGNTQDFESLSAGLSALVSQLQAAQEAIEALDAGTVTDQELADAVAALEEAIGKAQSSLQAAIGGVQSDLDAAVRELRAAIEANAADAAEKLAALEEAYKAADAVLSGDIAALQTADETLRGSIAALESAYKAADEAIWDAIEQLRGDLDDAKAELQAQIDSNAVIQWVLVGAVVVAIGIGAAGLAVALKNKKR